jgi:tRNA threonylcarbamoyladenosine biosynthesis protein TsaB
MILTIKTADMNASLVLFDGDKEVGRTEWESGRQLSNDLLKKIEELVGEWRNLTGIVVFKGPGSFTSLRIGITIANTLSDSLGIPIAGTHGPDWIDDGMGMLQNGESYQIVLPEYGGEANITKQKK